MSKFYRAPGCITKGKRALWWTEAIIATLAEGAQKRPLLVHRRSRRAPPPLSDQQAVWWYNTLAEPPQRSKMADSKLTDHTAIDSHQEDMYFLFTAWELRLRKKG